MPAKFVKSIGRTLDARPDRLDLRDREFTPNVVSLPQQWPDDAAIRSLLPRYCKSGLVLDQGSEGACTGFGLACVVNYLHWRVALALGDKRKQHPVSPRMLYHLARFYDEWPGEDYDGSSCRGALKAWHKHGVCTEHMWPYRDKAGHVRFVKPGDGWAEDAMQRRLGVYYRLNRASVVDMQAAIHEIGAIYVSADVHDGWGIEARTRKIDGHASLPAVKGIRKADSLGGHAFALVGYNRIGFVVQNSWGLPWGNCGFGVMPYEEWVKYGTDAWITALGVAAHASKTSSVPAIAKEKTVIARAGAITFVSGNATELPPKVQKEVTRWNTEEAYRHTLVMGNDGEVINRIFTHENGATCVRDLACEAPQRFWQGGAKPRRIAIYAHGGLNSEDASVARIQTLAPYFKANGIYPVFLTWRTGPTETLSSILEDELKKVPRPEGDIGDLFERVKETAAEVLDRTVEVLARPAAKPIWSQMKQNAASAVEPSRGCTLLADALVQLKAAVPQLEIHLIGHSAGSIILGHLLDLLPARKLDVTSCHLYAPACTVRFAVQHYVPAIDNKVLPRKRFHIHLLSDAVEICDTVGPYRKSLLYLVSRALETCHKMPILGLEQAFDAKANPKWHEDELESVKLWQKFWNASGNGLDVVNTKQVSTGTLGRRIRACHGSFDNDATTIETTLRRIIGAKPPYAVEWIDY
ncbi:MAG TPA: C1 family peptidase [Steroidobacteraceae bacterium]|nr:C1 family peptidase [Steroidobacteraceae bacterium]